MGYYNDLSISHERTADDDYLDRRDGLTFRTARQYTEHLEADTRRRLDGARIAAGLRDGSIQRTAYERCLVLAARRAAHLKAGRVRAAAACKENAMRILEEMGY